MTRLVFAKVNSFPGLGYGLRYLAATCWATASVDTGFATTHVFINRQALKILAADNWQAEADFLQANFLALQAGTCWADGGRGFTTHYFDPYTTGGLWKWASGAWACSRFFNRALESWRWGKRWRAMFFLGAASHLVQDASEPHHARCRARDGHSEYEKWVQAHKEEFVVTKGGLYRSHGHPVDWMRFNARTAYDYFWLVQRGRSTAQYRAATRELLPLAQRSTAGFWIYFLRRVSAVGGTWAGTAELVQHPETPAGNRLAALPPAAAAGIPGGEQLWLIPRG